MLKKYFSIFTVAVALLTLGSCSSELEDMEPTMPNQTEGVTIYVNMPEPLQSRSTKPLQANYGDGSRANELHYAIYLAGTDEIIYSSEKCGEGDSWTVVPAGSRNFNTDMNNPDMDYGFKFELPYVAKGQKYDMIFWAQYKGTNKIPFTAYKFDPKTREVTISYTDAEGNAIVDGADEGRDAFFTRVKDFDISAQGGQTYITLRRPFAQLNIGSDDKVGAEWSGLTYEKCKVEVKEVYTKLNLWTGVASEPTTVTFDWVEELNGNNISYGIPGYRWLSMNYILTGSVLLTDEADNVNKAQKETKDVHIYLNGNNGTWNHDIELSGIPFQRNYKTYIHGHLFTTTEEGINLSIVLAPEYYEPDYTEEI